LKQKPYRQSKAMARIIASGSGTCIPASLGTRKDLLKVFMKELEEDNRREITQDMGISAEQGEGATATTFGEGSGAKGKPGFEIFASCDGGA